MKRDFRNGEFQYSTFERRNQDSEKEFLWAELRPPQQFTVEIITHGTFEDGDMVFKEVIKLK